jgi:O-antigen/teichoic acid export membrane protein
LLSRRSRLKYRISFVELVRIFRIAVPIRMAGLLNLGLDPITRAALARYAGVEAAALYEIAYRVIFQLRFALVSGLQTIVPYLSSKLRGSGLDSRSTVLAAAEIAISAGAPLFTLAVLGMPALSVVVTARSSPAIGLYAGILAIAWMINVAAAPGYFANIVEGRVRRNWICQGVICGVNAGLAPLLGDWWGAIGVCVATASAVACGSLTTLAGRGHEAWQLLRQLSRGDYLALLGGAAAATTLNLLWDAGISSRTLFALEAVITFAYLLAIAPALIVRIRSLILVRGPAS